MYLGRIGGGRGVVSIAVSALRDTDGFSRAACPDGASDHHGYHAPRDDRPYGVPERFPVRFTKRFPVRFFDGVSVPLSSRNRANQASKGVAIPLPNLCPSVTRDRRTGGKVWCNRRPISSFLSSQQTGAGLLFPTGINS
jgi:hypothetical protein